VLPMPTLVASLLKNPVRLLVEDVGLVSSENWPYNLQNKDLTFLSLVHRMLSRLADVSAL